MTKLSQEKLNQYHFSKTEVGLAESGHKIYRHARIITLIGLNGYIE